MNGIDCFAGEENENAARRGRGRVRGMSQIAVLNLSQVLPFRLPMEIVFSLFQIVHGRTDRVGEEKRR